jgi:hypothetical protein
VNFVLLVDRFCYSDWIVIVVFFCGGDGGGKSLGVAVLEIGGGGGVC